MTGFVAGGRQPILSESDLPGYPIPAIWHRGRHVDLSRKSQPEIDGAQLGTVDFYWRPGCPFCFALEHGLTRAGVELNKINIWEDPAAAAQVREITGGDETVPTVVVNGAGMVNPGVPEVVDALPRNT